MSKLELSITTYGSAVEVGRSAICVHDRDRSILLDAGVKIMPKTLQPQNSLPPEGIDPIAPSLDAIILTHAHLDHSGYIPAMYRAGFTGSTYMTNPTKEIVNELWHDHLKIEGPYHYSPNHLQQALAKTLCKKYNKEFKIADGISAKFMDAGHILGSASILIDWEGLRILYTGDINNQPTPFHDGVQFPDPDEEPADILITETTNSIRSVPSRKNVAGDLAAAIQKTCANDGKVIIPSFAVGRGQELQLYLIWELGEQLSKIPLYVDGMICRINHIYESYLSNDWISPRILAYIKEHQLKSPFDHEGAVLLEREKIKGNVEAFRRKITKKAQASIILTTSGMLEGGPILSYLKVLGSEKNNLLSMVGYQVEGTIGHAILQGVRNFVIQPPWNEPSFDLNLQLEIQDFNFSGHISLAGLEEYARFANPQRILPVHGSEESLNAYTKRIKSLGYVVERLKDGGSLKIISE